VVLEREALRCNAKIEALLAPLQRHTVQLKASLKGKGKNNPAFDVRQAMANWAGVDLTRIDGLGVSIVMKLLSEIGTDLSRFANVKHFCSWLGLCPGTKISGGKVLSAGTKRSASRARQALKMAAMSLSRSDSALGAFYRSAVLAHGQAPGQHRRGPQAFTDGLLHADPRCRICRPRPRAVRGAAAPAQQRRPQAPRRDPWLPTRSCCSSRLNGLDSRLFLKRMDHVHPAVGIEANQYIRGFFVVQQHAVLPTGRPGEESRAPARARHRLERICRQAPTKYR
jgi:hypothetical protein